MSKTEERNLVLTRKRWLVLIASCLVNLCIGAMYAWSVFATPMAAYLSARTGAAVTAADLAIVFSIGNADGFITLIAGGFINQKLGPRWVVFAGGILFGLGFVVCGLATGIGMLILGYGILSGLAMGLAYGCTISNSVRFFPDKAGLVGGIATASYGISSVILPPVATAMIGSTDADPSGHVCRTFILFGIFVIVVVAVCSQFIIKCPEDFVPAGYNPPAAEGRSRGPVDKDWRGMLSSPVFYVMIIMLFFGAVFGMMVISQASQIAQKMLLMTPAAAALVVSVLALFNTFGRILCGRIADRIGCINTMTAVFIAAIFALLLLYVSGGTGSVPMFYVGVCLIGVCFGAFMGVYPSFTAQNFGTRNSSVNYGIMFIGFSAAGLIGPMITRSFAAGNPPFRGAFLVAVVLAVIGLLLSFVYRIFAARTE